MRLRALFLALVLPAAASANLRLEVEHLLPYRINQATAIREEGVLGDLRLSGLRWDGARVDLFRTRVEARSPKVDMWFYLDEDIRSVELVLEGPDGLQTDALALEEGEPQAPEVALRSRMRWLSPPIHLQLDGEEPQRMTLTGSDLLMAGLQASSSLFRFKTPLKSLLWLGLYVGASWLLTLPRQGSMKTWSSRLLVLVCLGATLAVVGLSGPSSTLYRVSFPGSDPDTRLSGTLERQVTQRPGYRKVVYVAERELGMRSPEQGRLELVGFWAPTGPGIAMEDVASRGDLVRFSTPPLVTIKEGEARIRTEDFITGWVIHGGL